MLLFTFLCDDGFKLAFDVEKGKGKSEEHDDGDKPHFAPLKRNERLDGGGKFPDVLIRANLEFQNQEAIHEDEREMRVRPPSVRLRNSGRSHHIKRDLKFSGACATATWCRVGRPTFS